VVTRRAEGRRRTTERAPTGRAPGEGGTGESEPGGDAPTAGGDCVLGGGGVGRGAESTAPPHPLRLYARGGWGGERGLLCLVWGDV